MKNLPKFLQAYIPSYDIEKLDKNNFAVKNEIITQVLNLGDEKATIWLFENYTLNEIKNAVKNPARGVWNEESLNYWKNIFKIDEIPGYKDSILNLKSA